MAASVPVVANPSVSGVNKPETGIPANPASPKGSGGSGSGGGGGDVVVAATVVTSFPKNGVAVKPEVALLKAIGCDETAAGTG